MTHHILTQAVDTVLHVQLFDPRRDPFHILVMLLHLERSRRRLISMHRR